jgi:hypothetical protein
MTTKNHGTWIAYRPVPIPEAAPRGAMFTNRESDGKDWYVFVNEDNPFERPQNVKMCLRNDNGQWIVGAAVYDATMLFPQVGQLILEVIDYTGTDPQAEFGGKIWDEANDTFSDPLAPAASTNIDINSLLARIAALEAKIKTMEGKDGV